MKLFFINITAALITLFFMAGCSELDTSIEQPVELKVHKEGILNPHSDHFHGKVIKNNNWDMRDCMQCHAGDFSGGVSAPTCNNCHTGPKGPASCNTCHGDFGDPSRPSPPEDLDGNTSTDLRTVGAHVQHLYENKIGASTPCGSCHVYPTSLYAEGHIDDTPGAEVTLKNRATLFGADNAAYDRASGTCSNTYCHGNFEFYRDSAKAENRFAYIADKITGLNKTVAWTKVNQGEAECGSCHGLPPAGHLVVPENSCYTCHQGVVDENNKIIDLEKHINGVANSRGE